MKQQRLDGLADGIFAIVMTLLAFGLKLPPVQGIADDQTLTTLLIQLWPAFFSLMISYALLFTYWRAHHFIASVYAKNLTVGLANINAAFFFLIALVPFSASLLGQYSASHVAIAVYGSNVIAIGLALYIMRRHIELDPMIETSVITKADRRSGYIRILFPVFAAAAAIVLCFWNPSFSIFLFAISILFNLMPESSNLLHRWLDVMFSDDADVIEGNYGEPSKLLDDEEYICVPKKMVFDHHRFQTLASQKKTKSGGMAPSESSKQKAVRKASAETPRQKAEERLERKMETKIEKNIERNLEQDIKEGSIEEIIRKKTIRTENE